MFCLVESDERTFTLEAMMYQPSVVIFFQKNPKMMMMMMMMIRINNSN